MSRRFHFCYFKTISFLHPLFYHLICGYEEKAEDILKNCDTETKLIKVLFIKIACMMEFFARIVNSFQLFTIFAKTSIQDF